MVVVAAPQRARAAGDPSLLWQSIETAHFRVSFYSGEEEVAQHVADLAESIHARMAPVMGWRPRERTEIVLTDGTDSANGSATALPFNTVRLYLTAPDDLSPLGDVDDWYLELLTHEYTHILHTDQIRGLPALLNGLMGKTFAPNQAQPRWLLEGLAIVEESTRTSGGRLRSSQWQMYMRTDILEGNAATLDQFTNTPRRWPQGNLWYLYGSFFLKWIQDTYGEEAIRKMIRDYGSWIIPWGINRSVRRATGSTFEELYPAWIDSLRRGFGAQAAAVKARGLREGVRLTHSGQGAASPRFLPAKTWPGHGGELLYFRDDAHSTGGLYRLPLRRDRGGHVVGADEDDAELMIRTAGTSTPSFEPDGSVIFDSPDVHNVVFSFEDLHRMPAGQRGTTGLEGNRVRLTQAFRASQPDVSPDGRRVVFVSNHRGTSYLQVAGLGDAGLTHVHALVPSGRFELAFSPRWSPDGKSVVYSVWQHGGFRDLRIVDVATGSWEQPWRDRAIDGGPVFSPDGKRVFFHSDRTGIMNVYAYDLATKEVRQVTNVLTGAYQPQVSPDGKTLVYLGYTHRGFDLFAMDLDESRWLPALPFVDDRPAPHPEPTATLHPVRPYDPWKTILPRAYSVSIYPGNFGQAIAVTASGTDVAGFHGVGMQIVSELERPELQPTLQYAYGRLPFDVGASISRSIQPRQGYSLGSSTSPPWVQETTSVSTNLSFAMPRAFDGQGVGISYSAARVAGDFARPGAGAPIDPYDRPIYPQLGFLSFIGLGWSYSNVQRFLWGAGAEKGFSASLNFNVTDPALGSEYSAYALSGNLTGYLLMPWFRHHSLGLHAGAGTSGGSNYPGRSPYYVGGYVDVPVEDAIRNLIVQGGIVLRGYPPVTLTGRNYTLLNAEYRFPILNVDRGLSTLPVFLSRIQGATYLDYGSAFDDLALARFKAGVGSEAQFDLQLGYSLSFTFRAGYAQGLSTGGLSKPYFVAAFPF